MTDASLTYVTQAKDKIRDDTFDLKFLNLNKSQPNTHTHTQSVHALHHSNSTV